RRSSSVTVTGCGAATATGTAAASGLSEADRGPSEADWGSARRGVAIPASAVSSHAAATALRFRRRVVRYRGVERPPDARGPHGSEMRANLIRPRILVRSARSHPTRRSTPRQPLLPDPDQTLLGRRRDQLAVP